MDEILQSEDVKNDLQGLYIRAEVCRDAQEIDRRRGVRVIEQKFHDHMRPLQIPSYFHSSGACARKLVLLMKGADAIHGLSIDGKSGFTEKSDSISVEIQKSDQDNTITQAMPLTDSKENIIPAIKATKNHERVKSRVRIKITKGIRAEVGNSSN